MFEIVLVPSRDDETIYTRGGGDHAILEELVGFPVHEPTPSTKTDGIHRQDLI